MRTDSHKNPTAFTTDMAHQAGLVLGVDYEVGDAFPGNPVLKTARLLGDPIAITVKVINAVGFHTKTGLNRWTYISLPGFVWSALNFNEKRDVIGYMYQHEGGTAMVSLFPHYGLS